MLLHGIFPPITTPFYPDGNVYFKKLESNVERYSRTPCAGIVVLGSTGEAILLSDQERRDVLKSAREAAAPNKVLVAGTGIESAIETLRLTEYAAELGYDVAMVRTPHYYKKQMQPDNILAFYRTVADRSPLPVIIYNFPQATGYDIPAELVIALAEHPNLIGIKESSGAVEKVRRMVEGTRHIRRSATVTETFEAITPRMLAAAASGSSGDGGELVQVSALGGASSGKASSSAVTIVGKMKTRQKEVGIPGAGGRGSEAASFTRRGSRGRDSGFRLSCSDFVLRDLRGVERRRRRTSAAKTGSHCRLRAARRGRPRNSRREVWNGLQRILRWSGAAAAATTHRRGEKRSGATAGGCEELARAVFCVRAAFLSL